MCTATHVHKRHRTVRAYDIIRSGDGVYSCSGVFEAIASPRFSPRRTFFSPPLFFAIVSRFLYSIAAKNEINNSFFRPERCRTRSIGFPTSCWFLFRVNSEFYNNIMCLLFFFFWLFGFFVRVNSFRFRSKVLFPVLSEIANFVFLLLWTGHFFLFSKVFPAFGETTETE